MKLSEIINEYVKITWQWHIRRKNWCKIRKDFLSILMRNFFEYKHAKYKRIFAKKKFLVKRIHFKLWKFQWEIHLIRILKLIIPSYLITNHWYIFFLYFKSHIFVLFFFLFCNRFSTTRKEFQISYSEKIGKIISLSKNYRFSFCIFFSYIFLK